MVVPVLGSVGSNVGRYVDGAIATMCLGDKPTGAARAGERSSDRTEHGPVIVVENGTVDLSA